MKEFRTTLIYIDIYSHLINKSIYIYMYHVFVYICLHKSDLEFWKSKVDMKLVKRLEFGKVSEKFL